MVEHANIYNIYNIYRRDIIHLPISKYLATLGHGQTNTKQQWFESSSLSWKCCCQVASKNSGTSVLTREFNKIRVQSILVAKLNTELHFGSWTTIWHFDGYINILNNNLVASHQIVIKLCDGANRNKSLDCNLIKS